MILDELLQNASTIGISGHVRPDGDCVGSTLGLYLYIKDNYPQKDVCVYLEEIPEVFSFLSGASLIRHEVEEGKKFDLYFAVDCGDTQRLGDFAQYFLSAKKTACIDHHKSNLSFAQENYIIPEYSSSCELVFNLLDKDKITKEIAECLYTGMVHDTGVFQYSSTTAQTMAAAGFLMSCGINFARIIDETYYQKTFGQNKILGTALDHATLCLDGQVIVSYVNDTDLQHAGVTNKELDGIVNQLRITKGVEVAVFLYECAAMEYKISLRSKQLVDVSEIAVKYGGGGHARAAGVTMRGNTSDLTDLMVKEIKQRLA